ncbi:MAG: citramalate synthase [Candidatus Dormibacteria bacterium]
MRNLEIYDTTLRDGAQGVGISFSVADKLKIARRLDALGVSHIEGGFPGANPKDTEFFAEMRSVTLEHATLTAFGATRRPEITAPDDIGLRQLLDSGTSTITLVGKTWDLQVRDIIRTELDENVRMITESVAFLRGEGRDVFFDAEHFFDGHASDPGYAIRCLEAAAEAGAARLILCDTNGGMLPDGLGEIVLEMVDRFGDRLGIHCHNDAGVAIANSLAAVRGGVVQVQGCINGYGERTGNADLCTLIPNLQLKMARPVVTDSALHSLTDTAAYVSEIANVAPEVAAPYVGEAAFTHKGGQHVNAVMKAPYAYQHIDPELVGNRRRVVVSEQSGRATVLFKSEQSGIDIEGDGALARQIAEEVKQLEAQGYSFEGAEASFELLVHRARGHRAAFELIDFITLVEQRGGKALVSEATVKVRVGDRVVHTAAEGNGPVNAIDSALRKALIPSFPELEAMGLHDYKVRVLDGSDGTAARVRVLIESGDHRRRWSTVGCSSNIIEASWLALADAFDYALVGNGSAARSAGAE